MTKHLVYLWLPALRLYEQGGVSNRCLFRMRQGLNIGEKVNV